MIIIPFATRPTGWSGTLQFYSLGGEPQGLGYTGGYWLRQHEVGIRVWELRIPRLSGPRSSLNAFMDAVGTIGSAYSTIWLHCRGHVLATRYERAMLYAVGCQIEAENVGCWDSVAIYCSPDRLTVSADELPMTLGLRLDPAGAAV